MEFSIMTLCAGCPQGNGEYWCNGDCQWIDDQCIKKSEEEKNSDKNWIVEVLVFFFWSWFCFWSFVVAKDINQFGNQLERQQWYSKDYLPHHFVRNIKTRWINQLCFAHFSPCFIRAHIFCIPSTNNRLVQKWDTLVLSIWT